MTVPAIDSKLCTSKFQILQSCILTFFLVLFHFYLQRLKSITDILFTMPQFHKTAGQGPIHSQTRHRLANASTLVQRLSHRPLTSRVLASQRTNILDSRCISSGMVMVTVTETWSFSKGSSWHTPISRRFVSPSGWGLLKDCAIVWRLERGICH